MDWKKYIEYVEKTAKERAKAQHWTPANEVDFFMGATCLFFFLDAADKIPARWVIAPLAGMRILEEEAKENA